MKKSTKDYWKNKIGYDFDEEYQIYSILCERKFASKKNKHPEIDTKSKWDNYLMEKYKNVDKELLKDFYYHLRACKRDSDVYNRMQTNFLVPIVVSLVFSIGVQQLLSWLEETTSNVNNFFVDLFVVLGSLFVFMIAVGQIIKLVTRENISGNQRFYFYNDYMEIISSMSMEFDIENNDVEDKCAL